MQVIHFCIKPWLYFVSLWPSFFGWWTGTWCRLTWLLKTVWHGSCDVYLLSVAFSHSYRRRRETHLLWGKCPANDRVAAKSPKARPQESPSKILERSTLGSLLLAHPPNFVPSSLPPPQLPFPCAVAASPDQQLNSPFVCVADDKCTEDILCFRGRQGTYFDWCAVVEKNELGRNYNGGPADGKGIY